MRVISATEAILQGAVGIILESVLEGMAEYYSAELSEKVIRGQTENAYKCKFNGGTIPFGYIIDKENTTLPLLKKQLSETEKSINNMLDAIQQGIITSSTKKRLEDLEIQKKKIEINIAQESIKKQMLTKDQVVFWFERLRKIDITDIKHRK